jgi:3-hydroxyacyl-CoA dehydrogenase
MGSSWAGLFAAAGLQVRLYDVEETRLAEAKEGAAASARFLASNGLAQVGLVEMGLSQMSVTADIEEALASAGLVQECVREDLALKREVFADIDAVVPPEALICTSSSYLSISDIQTAALRPQRCLAAHPYNPPHLVPLVELAPGKLTAPDAMQRAREFYSAVGKEPVMLARDVSGYIGNRLSAALWREAIDLVVSGVARVEDVDRAVRFGPGLRWAAMGPHLLYELGGGASGIRGHLEHLGGLKEEMLRDLATWTEFPSATSEALVEGLDIEKGGRSYEELVAQRDELLVAYLLARGPRHRP